MKKKSLLFLILSALINGLMAQNFKAPSVVEPDAASFKKFIDFPVTPYNGTEDISIPVYELKDGAVNLPITLRYNSSGIKVAEEASWVGLGWNLNMGGSITVDIKGEQDLPDEYQWANQNGNFKTSGDAYFINNVNYNPFVNYETGTHEMLNKAEAGNYLPDVYNYNFPGGSGKFVIDYYENRNGVIKFLNKNKNIKVNIISNNGDNYWQAITEDGTIYNYFGPIGHTYSETFKLVSMTYYLSEIIYQTGESVHFYYVKNSGLGKSVSVSTSSYIWDAVDGSPQPTSNTLANTLSTSTYDNIYIKTIQTPNFKVEFTTGSRTDIANGSALKQITVTDKTTSKQRFFEFGNSSYFESDLTGNFYTYDADLNTIKQRLKLDSFGETGLPKYVFSYNTTKLPVKTSYAVDYWGFYNGQITNLSLLPNIYNLCFYEKTKFQPLSLPSYLLDNNYRANRAVDPNFANACMLSSIGYPIGGKTEYYFEPNTFTNYLYPTVQQISDYYPNVLQKSITDDNCNTVSYPTNYSFTLSKPSRVRIAIRFERGASPSGTFQEMKDAYVSLGNMKWTIVDYNSTLSSIDLEYNDILPVSTYTLNVSLPDILGEQCGSGQQYPSTDPRDKHMNVRAMLYFTAATDLSLTESSGAGLRVNKIVHYPDLNDLTKNITRSYVYTNGKLMSPLKFHQIDENEIFLYGEAKTPAYTTLYNLYSYSVIANSYSAGGALVGYDVASILDVNSTNQTSNGKTTLKFYNSPANFISPLDPFEERRYNLPVGLSTKMLDIAPYTGEYFSSIANVPLIENNLNGMLKYEVYFNSVNDTIKEELYTYNLTKDKDCVNGIMAKNKLHGGTDATIALVDGCQICFYPIRTGGFVNITKTLIDHLPSAKLSQSTLYEYNNNDLISKEKTTTSKGDLQEVSYKYAFDFQSDMTIDLLSIPNTSDYSNSLIGISNMAKNNIQIPIETTKKINRKIVESSYTEFNLIDNMYVLPKKSYHLKTTQTLDSSLSASTTTFKKASVSNNQSILIDPHYSNNEDISLDYTQGKISKITANKDDIKSFIWGYNNSLLLAKIENATLDKVAYLDCNDASVTGWIIPTGSILANSINIASKTINSPYLPAGEYRVEFVATSTSVGTVAVNGASPISIVPSKKMRYSTNITLAPLSQVNLTGSSGQINLFDIRIFPKMAQMTSYTYTPIYGITSQTDPNGITQYFEYDNFGRLSYIKDQDGNILKKMTYHYIGQ